MAKSKRNSKQSSLEQRTFDPTLQINDSRLAVMDASSPVDTSAPRNPEYSGGYIGMIKRFFQREYESAKSDITSLMEEIGINREPKKPQETKPNPKYFKPTEESAREDLFARASKPLPNPEDYWVKRDMAARGAKALKRKVLGFFGRDKFITKDEFADALISTGIATSPEDSYKVIPKIDGCDILYGFGNCLCVEKIGYGYRIHVRDIPEI